MKKRQGFALIELPIVLCTFGLVLFAAAALLRGKSAALTIPLAITGAIFCLPLLILLCTEFLPRR